LNAVAVAPLAHAGLVIVTSAGAPPFTVKSLPAPLNVSVPVPIDDGVPAVPPATSAPGTVMA
jgi:hypothetical protein